MTTDNEITKGDVPAYMNDTLRLFYAELPKGETDYVGMLTRLAVIIDNKARADQFRKDTDERVQSIKDAKQEQLAEDIRAIEVLYAERHNHLPLGTGEFHIGYLQGLKDGLDALKKQFEVY